MSDYATKDADLLSTCPLSWAEINSRRILPGGCVTVRDAFNTIGKFSLTRPSTPKHNQWTGEEADYRDLGPKPAQPREVFAKETSVVRDWSLFNRDRRHVASLLGINPAGHPGGIGYEEWRQAVDIWKTWETVGPAIKRRRLNTFALMKRLGSTGRLRFVTFDDTTGETIPIASTKWNCSTIVANARFGFAALSTDQRWFLTHPHDPHEYRGFLTSFKLPLFVDGASLKSLLPRLDEHMEAAIAAVASGLVDKEIADIIVDEYRRDKAAQVPPPPPSPSDLPPENSSPTTQKKPVPHAELERWIKRRNREGASQSQLIKERLTAFPNNCPPARDTVVKLDGEIRKRMNLAPRRTGPQKKSGE